jgi:hypothetical protein
MMAFQALGMSVYALSRHVALAIAASIVIVLTGVAEGIAVYPVTLMGTSETYGALGLSLLRPRSRALRCRLSTRCGVSSGSGAGDTRRSWRLALVQ